MAAPKVPSIPITALDAVQDRNVYTVLRAIADILNVRNGQTGDSGSAFVTREELGNLRRGGLVVNVPGAQQTQGATPQIIRPSDIARVINDLQAQVMESALFKSLGERVDRVDAPGTGVIAQLDEERITRANAVAALAQLITTLEATVGDQSVALQEEAEVRANADGQIMGRFSVKIDANGYVTGFGLISTANNATPYSEFMVRADRFSIASPSGPGITPRVPFIVLTTPTTVNGYPVPAGVYMDAAMIQVASVQEAHIDFAAIRRAHIQDAAIGTAQIENAAITNAKIGTAEVDTLKLAGQAVTIPASVYSPNPVTRTTGTHVEAQVSLTSTGAPITIIVSYGIYGDDIVETWLERNGVIIWSRNFGGVQWSEPGICASLSEQPGAGVQTYSLVCRTTQQAFTTYSRSIVLLETKR
ncbi:phage tail tip fiber protein [Cupriavidus alkaliphilus]|uniref:Tip attachment protein J central straight fiber domain-containing protein n=1 Tax=Cupriavidus alkaliphilus TaxID=942866 RepID=A0A7W4VFG4_9BURK|nr:DUF1983 domain-containing protein [Cupriavidus alkaliphilus]MBB3010625.1 hypothetical protein [Cupriavidus alkaliphilus]